MHADKLDIPIMFCFDNNYVIPAAVAFYSLLENCNQSYYYKLYVLHTDITKENQEKLKENIEKFSDFSGLEFINMEHRFEELWESISIKGHFSKEVMYKVLVASIFPQYDKLIVSDVDVIFQNDISESYLLLDVKEDIYLAGVKMIGKMKWYIDKLEQYTKEEQEKLLGFCGGYIVFNLKKLREEKMEEKFIDCFKENGYRINQMEQDVLNLCCYPKTKKLPLKYVACSYIWDIYQTEDDKITDEFYTKEEIEDAMQNTVQLHYATSIKPWKNPDCTKSKEWFQYIVKTNFLEEYLKNLPEKIVLSEKRIQEIENRIKKEVGTVSNKRLLKKLKNKINANQDKRIYRIIKYVLKHPFFILTPSFYRKLYGKIKNKINKQEFLLLILDDVFPSELSPFRYEEYITYFKNFEHVYAITTGTCLPALKENRSIKEVIQEFEHKFPQYENRIFDIEDKKYEQEIRNLKNKLAIITFVSNLCNNIYDNIEFLEKEDIPFLFTLYPGGGFKVDDKESDTILKRAFSSKCFRKVIVTQKLTYDYLIKKEFCKKEDIEFIYGIVTPQTMLNKRLEDKVCYGYGKENIDICFVAHKYSKLGEDKGYDLFIESAKRLSKIYHNIKFHVVGGFTEEDIELEHIKDNITFYGIKPSDWLIDFYRNMDIILSPNRPFVLGKGAFDGFPTGACTEAMLNRVALICTDELRLNIKYENNKDLIIVKPEVKDIVEQIEMLYQNPKKIKKIMDNGSRKVKKYYSYKVQNEKRIKVIKKIIKLYKREEGRA